MKTGSCGEASPRLVLGLHRGDALRVFRELEKMGARVCHCLALDAFMRRRGREQRLLNRAHTAVEHIQVIIVEICFVALLYVVHAHPAPPNASVQHRYHGGPERCWTLRVSR